MDLPQIFGDLLVIDYFAVSPFIFHVSEEWLLYIVVGITPSTKGIGVDLRSKSVYQLTFSNSPKVLGERRLQQTSMSPFDV